MKEKKLVEDVYGLKQGRSTSSSGGAMRRAGCSFRVHTSPPVAESLRADFGTGN